MVSLDELRKFMRKQAEEDKQKKSVQVTGASIEQALNQASIELGVPVKKIEYEILAKGAKGTFGMGRKDWILIAYEAIEAKALRIEHAVSENDFDSRMKEEEQLDQNGDVFIRSTPDGVLMKVTRPVGKGRRANEKLALERLMQRGINNYDAAVVSKIVRAADNQYVKIADFVYNPVNDAIITIDISDFDMKVFVTIQPPGKGGTDLDANSILNFLRNNGIVYGIKEDVVRDLEQHPQYGTPVLLAEGTAPRHGSDAKVVYNFAVDRTEIKLKEKDGRVDFKEMNLIQNVVEGQSLARKIPHQMGKNGSTVKGKIIPAKDGVDVKINIGKNVKLSQDGMTAVAAINGQVVIASDKLNVEPIYVVQGNVNLKTGGNVIFLGTVLVKGSVDDGFKVKAAGNIEVMGTVGKADLDAEGDIIVHQGITAKSGGSIRAGKSVWAKFVENAEVEAGEMVVVSDGIINSKVSADKRVICQGKRASIVGGKVRATEEINAKQLGSVAGGETIVEVGYDPKSKAKLLDLETELNSIIKVEEEVDLNIHTLENILRMKKSLPEEKIVFYKEQKGKKAEIEEQKGALSEEMEKLKEYLASLKITGKISASGKVFPGVKVYIKDAFLDVRNDFKAVTFLNDSGMVKVNRYEEPEGDYSLKK
ncbi:MAG: DUF342 domain-containing protein [Spirochaetales bacterium]|nr:DUF342 domain-containing protein [Spirochaetales bacterium]